MAVYKVSYVVTGSDYPGTIANEDHRPVVGERVILGDEEFEVIEVMDLMPNRGEFHFIHATCKPAGQNEEEG